MHLHPSRPAANGAQNFTNKVNWSTEVLRRQRMLTRTRAATANVGDFAAVDSNCYIQRKRNGKISTVRGKTIAAWILFIGVSALTYLVYATLWDARWYFLYLSIFGLLACALAFHLLRQTGLRFWPVAGVTIVLLIGQWWVVQRLINRLFFHFSGFAP
jgi:hypothetical protein